MRLGKVAPAGETRQTCLFPCEGCRPPWRIQLLSLVVAIAVAFHLALSLKLLDTQDDSDLQHCSAAIWIGSRQ